MFDIDVEFCLVRTIWLVVYWCSIVRIVIDNIASSYKLVGVFLIKWEVIVIVKMYLVGPIFINDVVGFFFCCVAIATFSIVTTTTTMLYNIYK